MQWIAFALMTTGAVLCVVWPLLRARAHAPDPASTDAAFYRRQLDGIESDVARGLLSPTDAEGSRAELGRRLIANVEGARDGASGGSAERRRRLVIAVLAVALVPGISLALYGRVGSPGHADEPLAARLTPSDDIAQAIARIEAHLAADPNDGRGFDVIAPVYMQMGRFSDAATAYATAIRLDGSTAARQAGYGQALVMTGDGIVTAAAREAFGKALASDPRSPQARYFLGLAADQDGDKTQARTLWSDLVADAPPDAPWLGMVRTRLAALDNAAVPQPTGPAAQGIASLPPEQREKAIRGMVDGLAARLAQNGHDPDGWLRLVRAYKVLGDTDKARQALDEARRSLDGDAQALARLGDLAHELGIDG